MRRPLPTPRRMRALTSRLFACTVLALTACSTTLPDERSKQFQEERTATVEVTVRQRPGSTPVVQATRILVPATAQAAVDKIDAWGGSLAWPPQQATGFFHVQKRDERWWFIDPEGRPFIHAGLVETRPGASANARAAFARRFGTMEKWAGDTVQWLHDNGFNGVGAWSDTSVLGRTEYRLPQTRIVNFMSDYAKSLGTTHVVPGHTGYFGDAIPVFDPGFEAFATRYATRLAGEARNPAIIGWFSDNEMPLEERTLDNFLKLPPADANAREAERWLAARQNRREADRAAITQDDRRAWVGHVYATYARIVSGAIRRADPNHLYLGSRFHGGELKNPYVFEAAGKYLDVISVNYYRTWSPDQALVRNWAQWAGRPVLITEWYVKGEDSGLPNTSGAGWVVPTQAARGQFYQHFVLGLLETRAVVGWHWFKYQDNDPDNTEAELSNRDANKGMLDLHYAPYPALVDRARELNLRKYSLIRGIDDARP